MINAELLLYERNGILQVISYLGRGGKMYR